MVLHSTRKKGKRGRTLKFREVVSGRGSNRTKGTTGGKTPENRKIGNMSTMGGPLGRATKI